MRKHTMEVPRRFSSPIEVSAWQPGVPGLRITEGVGDCRGRFVITHLASGMLVSHVAFPDGFATLAGARRWVRRPEMLALDWTLSAEEVVSNPAVRRAVGVDEPAPEPEQQAQIDLDRPASDERFTWEGEDLDVPSLGEVRDWILFDGVAEALDGCTVEPDGTCPHGAPSWPRALGMV